LEELTPGSEGQWKFIKGTDQENPILIFLHSDSGEPAIGMPSLRHFDAELIGHLTVVRWDRRGAGKSYNNQG
jgi:pimeloyl-ACP methyl ester carboxylesterase